METTHVTVQAALWNLAETLKAWNELQDERIRLTTHFVGVLRRHGVAPEGSAAAARR